MPRGQSKNPLLARNTMTSLRGRPSNELLYAQVEDKKFELAFQVLDLLPVQERVEMIGEDNWLSLLPGEYADQLMDPYQVKFHDITRTYSLRDDYHFNEALSEIRCKIEDDLENPDLDPEDWQEYLEQKIASKSLDPLNEMAKILTELEAYKETSKYQFMINPTRNSLIPLLGESMDNDLMYNMSAIDKEIYKIIPEGNYDTLTQDHASEFWPAFFEFVLKDERDAGDEKLVKEAVLYGAKQISL